jgi:hypothetical protein
MTAVYATHSTHIPPINSITDNWAWLVRHSTRHCVHMKSVDNRFSLISFYWGLTKKMFPITGWRIVLIILQLRKNSPILLQTNQQWKLVSNTAVVWENIQDNDSQLSVHRTNFLISTIITQCFTSWTSTGHLRSLHIFGNYNHKNNTAITFLHQKAFNFKLLNLFFSYSFLIRNKIKQTKIISNWYLL